MNSSSNSAHETWKALSRKALELYRYSIKDQNGWISIWPDELSEIPFIAKRSTLLPPPSPPPTSNTASAPNPPQPLISRSPQVSRAAYIPSSAPFLPSHSPGKRAPDTTLASERSPKRAKTRTGLPLTLNADAGPATVLACADSGSEENIISLDVAQALGYDIDGSPSKKRQFVLANGSTVEALGEIVAECSFGIDTTPEAAPMLCVFSVFIKLASPIIMGLAFLEQTMTLSKHRHRLIKVPRPTHQPLQVYSVGRPRDRLFCYLDSLYVPAIPDSGSEINLMTRRFASEKGFDIQQGKEVIEFADGSTATTSGVVQGELGVRKSDSTTLRIIPKAKFYLLDNLRHDLIVGEDPLEELEVFIHGQHWLFPTTLGSVGLNRIRHIGPFDHMLLWIRKKIGQRRRRQKQSDSNATSVTDTLTDQQENDRREREEIRIAHLPIDQQESAIAAEALRQAQYDNTAHASS